jgi:hypothetical protein
MRVRAEPLIGETRSEKPAGVLCSETGMIPTAQSSWDGQPLKAESGRMNGQTA